MHGSRRSAEAQSAKQGPTKGWKAWMRSRPQRHDDTGPGASRVAAATPLHEQSAEALSAIPDDQLVAEYYRLRDVEAGGAGGPRFPNIRHIHGTPLEREKDRRETAASLKAPAVPPEMQSWYERARAESCAWWLDNHIVARHALRSCMSCGVCTSHCPAARFYEEYNPRHIVDIALSRSEERLVELLRSEYLWYCGQCGSCKPTCPRDNNTMGLISSLRSLSQLKGYHLSSGRGRQQYVARHLWGGNFWNRACSLYFRNVDAAGHREFGPRFARFRSDAELDAQMRRLGADPDRRGNWGGRKVDPETLGELRRCVQWGGTLALWTALEDHARRDAAARELSIDQYVERVGSEG